MPKKELFDQEEVLNKALHLFWEKGFNGTSVNELEKAMGINRSSIYNTYGDKDQLFIKAISLYKKQQTEALNARLAQAPSPLAAIRLAFQNTIDDVLADQKQKGCFVLNTTIELANQSPAMQQMVSLSKDLFTDTFTDLIRKAQAAGEIAAGQDAPALALYLFSALQGLRVTGMLRTSRTELEQIADHTLNVVVRS